MPKRHEYLAEGTFRLTQLGRLRKRALKSLSNCGDFKVPQRQGVRLLRHAELPQLDSTEEARKGTREKLERGTSSEPFPLLG
jgi:hypothetical protein